MRFVGSPLLPQAPKPDHAWAGSPRSWQAILSRTGGQGCRRRRRSPAIQPTKHRSLAPLGWAVDQGQEPGQSSAQAPSIGFARLVAAVPFEVRIPAMLTAAPPTAKDRKD
jgi:hypothetical protein